jgi:hypothetical protein
MKNKLLKSILPSLFWISTIAAPIGFLNFLVIYHSIILSLSSLLILSSISVVSFCKLDKIEREENNHTKVSNRYMLELLSIPLSMITGLCSAFVIMPDINKSDMNEIVYLNISRIIFPIILTISIYHVRKAMK